MALDVPHTGAGSDVKEAVAARLVPQLKDIQVRPVLPEVTDGGSRILNRPTPLHLLPQGNSVLMTDADDWATLRRWLIAQQGRPTLLVLDNAEALLPVALTTGDAVATAQVGVALSSGGGGE